MEKRNNLGYIEDEDDLGELIGTRAGLKSGLSIVV